MTQLHSDRARPAAGPKWIFGRVAQGLLFSLTVPLDAITEWMYQGVVARFPGLGPPEADAYVARDRGIYPGPTEPRAAWAVRARQWLATWRRAGSPFSVLQNVQAYFAPALLTVRLVTDSGHWYTRGDAVSNDTEIVLAVASRPPAIASNWAWDPLTGTKWWRCWVVVYLPPGFAHEIAYDDGSIYDGGATFDGVTAQQIIDVTNIAKAWLPAHARLTGVIFTTLQPTDSIPGFPGRHPFDPSDTSIALPDGSTSLPTGTGPGNWSVVIDPATNKPTRPPWASLVYEDES